MNDAHPAESPDTGPQRPSLLADWRVSCLIVFAVALSLRLIHHHDAMKSPLWDHNLPLYDSRYYDACARRIANGDLLGDEVFYLAPAYQYSLAACYRLVTDDWAKTLLIQNVFGAASCAIICWIGHRLLSPAAGLVAGLLAGTYGVLIYFDSLLLPYSQTLFLHLVAVAVMIKAADAPFRARMWLAVGLILGICAIAHGTALAIVPGVLLWLWLTPHGQTRRQSLISSGAVCLGCCAMVGVVTLRNYIVGKDFVLLTSNVGMNLYQGNNPDATGTSFPHLFPYKGANLEDLYNGFRRGPADLPPSEISRLVASEAWSFIRQNPGLALRLAGKKIRLLFNDLELPINDQYYFFKPYSRLLRQPLPTYGLLAGMGLIGMVVCAPRWRQMFPVYLLVLSQVLAYTLTFVLSRYRLVLAGGLIIFSAAWIGWCIVSWKERRRGRLAASVVAVIGLMVWTYSLPFGFRRENGFGQQYLMLADVARARLDFSGAEQAYRKAIESDFSPYRGDLSGIRLAAAYRGLGDVVAKSARWEEAAQSYRKALEEFAALKSPIAARQEVQTRESLREVERKLGP